MISVEREKKERVREKKRTVCLRWSERKKKERE